MTPLLPKLAALILVITPAHAERGPGETIFSAVVETFPGQSNDFMLPLTATNEEDHGPVPRLQGNWQVLTIPPYDAPSDSPKGPIPMMRVTLTPEADGYGGSFTPAEAMGGPQIAGGVLDRVIDENGYLYLHFSQPDLSPDPFQIALGPLGEHSYSGTMTSGQNVVPVVFWPDSQPMPELVALQIVIHGHAPQPPQGIPSDVEIVARCDESGGCSVTQGRLMALLPQGWAMNEPLFYSAVGDNLPTEFPMTAFYGPIPGQQLRLNPHQWLVSNGPCRGTDAGALCWFFDAADGTAAAAQILAPSLLVLEEQATTDPGADAPCAQSACRFALPEAGVAVELPRGWWVHQAGREGGAPRAQFTNGNDLIMLTSTDGWNPENGPCHDSVAGSVCFWSGTGNEVRIAAAFIAATLSLLPEGTAASP